MQANDLEIYDNDGNDSGFVLRSTKTRRRLKTGNALIDEQYYRDNDSGKWLIKYHLKEPDRETWALNELDKVHGDFR